MYISAPHECLVSEESRRGDVCCRWLWTTIQMLGLQPGFYKSNKCPKLLRHLSSTMHVFVKKRLSATSFFIHSVKVAMPELWVLWWGLILVAWLDSPTSCTLPLAGIRKPTSHPAYPSILISIIQTACQKPKSALATSALALCSWEFLAYSHSWHCS